MPVTYKRVRRNDAIAFEFYHNKQTIATAKKLNGEQNFTLKFKGVPDQQLDNLNFDACLEKVERFVKN